jgi:cell division septation protein DedD
LATHVQDDGFHEIQLNGKQLVFLFMAATVVSVVIFLCGVLVGRGVKSDRATSSAELSTAAVIPEAAPPPAAPPAVPAGSDPTSATPPQAVDDGNLSYFNRLEKSNTTEVLKPAPERPAEAPVRAARATPPPPLPVAAPKPVAAAPVAPPKPVAAAPAAPPKKEDAVAAAPPAAPASAGDYAIQVAALREAGEADTIAKRLVSKGYGAYVLTPPDGKPNVFRVRIGSFKTRREAEVVASKLQKEEQFKPWITR